MGAEHALDHVAKNDGRNCVYQEDLNLLFKRLRHDLTYVQERSLIRALSPCSLVPVSGAVDCDNEDIAAYDCCSLRVRFRRPALLGLDFVGPNLVRNINKFHNCDG